MHGTLVPLTTLHPLPALPLLSHGEQRIVESHLDGSSSSLLRRILLARGANPFHSHAITFRYENEPHVVVALVFILTSSRLRREAHFRATIALGELCKCEIGFRVVRNSVTLTEILHRALFRIAMRISNHKSVPRRFCYRCSDFARSATLDSLDKNRKNKNCDLRR